MMKLGVECRPRLEPFYRILTAKVCGNILFRLVKGYVKMCLSNRGNP